jgi:hypothetical protein
MKDIFNDMPFNYLTDYPNGGRHGHHDDFLSKDEHEGLRLLLAGAKAAFAEEDNDLAPDPQIHRNLRAMVAARKKSVSRSLIPPINITRLLNFRIPAYQVGFAMILVLVVSLFIGHNSGLNGNKNTVIVYKTDTVYEKMQKKAGATSISKDSQAEILAPSYSGGLFADSIDINGIESNTNSTQNHDLPADIKASPGTIKSLPDGRKIQSPAIIDTPNKGSSLIEDTSKWNRQMRG